MFSLCLAVGVGVGLVWSVAASPRPLSMRLLDGGLWVLAAALLGARLGYVAGHWSYYQQHAWEAPQLWLGGLSAAGAWLGAMAGLWLAAAYTGLPAGLLSDRLLPLAGCLSAAAWLGCWLNGNAYGLRADGAWWALPALDETGHLANRLPVQLLGALACLGLLALLDPQRWYFYLRRPRPGWLGGLWLLFQGLLLWGLSYLRADPLPLWQSLRLDGWGGLAVALAAGLWLLLLKRPAQNRPAHL